MNPWNFFRKIKCDLIIYNCLSLSWVETQNFFLTFSWDENPCEQTEHRVATYHLKFVNTRSLWVVLSFISAKSQENTLSFNSTQTQTIVNNQVIYYQFELAFRYFGGLILVGSSTWIINCFFSSIKNDNKLLSLLLLCDFKNFVCHEIIYCF